MQKLIFFVMLLFATPSFGVEPDKVAHFGTSVGYGLVSGTIVYHNVEDMEPADRMLTSFGLAMVPGLAVEIGDEFSKNGYFSWSDLAADVLGAATGSVAAEWINRKFWISASGRRISLVGKW